MLPIAKAEAGASGAASRCAALVPGAQPASSESREVENALGCALVRVERPSFGRESGPHATQGKRRGAKSSSDKVRCFLRRGGTRSEQQKSRRHRRACVGSGGVVSFPARAESERLCAYFEWLLPGPDISALSRQSMALAEE